MKKAEKTKRNMMKESKSRVEEKKSNNSLLINVLCMAAAFVICCVVVLISMTPTTYDVQIGEISSQTITAPRDIQDEETTRKLQEEAKIKVGPVYISQPQMGTESMNKIAEDLLAVEKARAFARQCYYGKQIQALQEAENDRVAKLNAEAAAQALKNNSDTVTKLTPDNITEEDVYFVPSEVSWDSILSEEDIASLQEKLPFYLGETDRLNLIRFTQEELAAISGELYELCESAYDKGFSADELPSTITGIIDEIEKDYNLSAQQSVVFEKILAEHMISNVAFDEEATKLEQDKAIASVEPVMYKKGQNIVVRGELVTEGQYAVLKASGLLETAEESVGYAWVFIYLAIIFAGFFLYISVFVKKIGKNTKFIAIISVFIAISAIAGAITSQINMYMLPAFISIILFAAIISPKGSVAYSVFISLVMIAVTSNNFAFFTEHALMTVLMTVSGGVFIALIIKKVAFRAALILAGAVSSIPCVLMQLIRWQIDMITESVFSSSIVWLICGCALFGVISVGLLPLIESMFKITTPMKLLELSDPNNTLLKRLLVEAPGTYHHSLYVGNLAEAACEAIGANSLLARVGAYYHDVGKLKNPKMFVENQRGGKNIHDSLSPKDSAKVIISHVSDGKNILEKAKLPKEIIAILQEHHGDTMVAYFYHKAQQQGETPNMADYRYPSSKPKTKESAVVMMADSVEAGMRSLEDPSKEEVYEFIKKIITGKLHDGQLEYVALTFKDLTLIINAFADIYDGAVHTRVKYPEIRTGKIEDEDSIL